MAQLVKADTATLTTIKYSSLGWLIARLFFASKTNLAAFTVPARQKTP
jgi:hypothetical protein